MREKAKKNRRVKTAAFKPAKEQELDLLTGESVRGFVCVRVCGCVTGGGQRSGGPGD